MKAESELRELTTLFCDMREFVKHSEQYRSDPLGLTRFLNRFLTAMTDVILANGGTIDKYMGDCVMAFWNAPERDQQHAAHACAAALEMFVRLERLNSELQKEASAEGRAFPTVNMGVGINTGQAVVGDLGPAQSFEYSVLGSAVNLASGFESQTKNYGTHILIGEETRRQAGDYATLAADVIEFRSQPETVQMHALVGDQELAKGSSFQAHKVAHENLITAYRNQDWGKAARGVSACRELDACGLGGLYDLLSDRIASLKADPPAADWDGVYRTSVERRATELAESVDALTQASQNKSQFVANMSHELRTPLNAILGYAELMLDGVYGDVPPKARDVLGRVEKNGHHLLGLINDVLDMSKIEAGELKLEIGDYAVSELIESTTSTTESLARKKGLEFRTILAEKLPAGRGDGRRLTQVLLNLVGNAIKFTDVGFVEISAQEVDGWFVFSVRDSGLGIAPEDHERVFGEFLQAERSSSSRAGSGTGLGLTISKRIVSLHGGTIELDSAPGEGSTFRVRIPVHLEQP